MGEKEKEVEKEKEEEEEGVDPLDAFMKGIQNEVRKVQKLESHQQKGGGMVVMTGVAKKAVDKNKGELVEQNQDGLEYSSEEETEDLAGMASAMSGYAINKQKEKVFKIDHNKIVYQDFRKDF